jgi:hypothetical protein
MSSGEATQTAKSDTKLTVEQRDHVLKHHLGLAIVDDRIRVSYVHECGNDPCPIKQEPFMLLCKRPPCY